MRMESGMTSPIKRIPQIETVSEAQERHYARRWALWSGVRVPMDCDMECTYLLRIEDPLETGDSPTRYSCDENQLDRKGRRIACVECPVVSDIMEAEDDRYA